MFTLILRRRQVSQATRVTRFLGKDDPDRVRPGFRAAGVVRIDGECLSPLPEVEVLELGFDNPSADGPE